MPPAIVVRAQKAFEQARSRSSVLDLLVRIQSHYGRVGASQQAGAVTYFAFLSFFPVLALAAFAVGVVDNVWPDASDGLTRAIDQIMPGLVGSGEGQVSLDDVQRFSGWAGIVGLLGVLYAGLGWIDALRTGLLAVFEVPREEQPSFLVAKRDDLVALVGIGLALFVSVVGAQTLTSFSTDVVDWLGFGWPWLLWLLTHVLSWAVSVLLFVVLFALVAKPHIPRRSLVEAAAIGAFGFELMKMVSFALLGSAKGSPAFQAFGVALVLLVWINYFTRVVFYAATYAGEVRRPQ
ncbi:YihY/virulence factor BrkB family protein [Nocardioides sp. Kera G14]|uniref:YihY/virulence factor BrkB family protein n=1 Tax=Nocardioides sp. Kera G14 TaxID=2884264 RepID=UPI001D117D9F|nr:YihY/virulence factor BrkB family protein [Nocardioides sp. Kera G14]UDY24384.1 YihY/virulence factor BrkB family protein [Nocardioides sp. Kera G14]